MIKLEANNKFSQNLRILHTVNSGFRNDIERIRKTVPITKLYMS